MDTKQCYEYHDAGGAILGHACAGCVDAGRIDPQEGQSLIPADAVSGECFCCGEPLAGDRDMETYNIDITDAYQGRDKDDIPFGYIGATDRGGYFFAWMNTKEATLDSLEADEIDPPACDFRDEARRVLDTHIGGDFVRPHAAAYGQYPIHHCRF